MRSRKKKRIYLLLGVTVLLIIFVKVFLLGGKPVYTFAELSGLQTGEVQRLVIRACNGGEPFLTEDPEAVAEFLDILASVTFTKGRDKGLKLNRPYTVDLFGNKEDYLRLELAEKEAGVAFYKQDRKVREERYSIDYDITSRLEDYFNSVFVSQHEKSTSVTYREIEPALCVVINNYPEARPSSGLQQADIVYEFLVEGGTSRYLAVYKKKYEDNFEIGPIRSLRPYLAVQSLEHGGIIAHSGYSTRTREMIKGLGITEIADMGDNFWRDRSRKAPHNLYTCTDNLYRIAADRIKEEERTYRPGNEKKEDEGDYEEGTTINIDYSVHNKVSYLYDEEKDVYLRYINEKPHTDRESGKQYYADRVIVRPAAHKDVLGPEGLVDIELGGSGEGALYEDGCKYSITWQKKGQETKYCYTNGDPVELIPGTTWIQIVRR
jgi:hypothetical protein